MTKEYKFSKETRKKMSQARKGRHYPNLSKSKTGKTHTADTRLKMSLAKRGSKSHFWRGGVYPLNRKIKRSVEYRLWRESVLERDSYTCIWCSSTTNLEVDHIKPFAIYPELRFAIDNGRVLCRPCHQTTDTWGSKAKNH